MCGGRDSNYGPVTTCHTFDFSANAWKVDAYKMGKTNHATGKKGMI